MTISKGLSYAIDANPGMVSLIAACRGDRPVGEVRAEVAARLGQDPARLAAAGLDDLRGLIEMGFLLPA